MAIQLLRAINNYIGVSADVKPTTDIDIGSTFTESDTTETYTFDGAGWFLSSPRRDRSTQVQMSIDYSHHEAHEGSMYHAHTSAAGGAATKATISFTTPNTAKWFHVVFFYRSNVEAIFTMGEGATVTAVSGTDYKARNRNRNIADASTAVSAGSAGGATFVTEGGTVTSFGTIIDPDHFGSGQKTGGEVRASAEWVLKKGTTYAFEVESQAATSEVGLALTWYEHTDRS